MLSGRDPAVISSKIAIDLLGLSKGHLSASANTCTSAVPARRQISVGPKLTSQVHNPLITVGSDVARGLSRHAQPQMTIKSDNLKAQRSVFPPIVPSWFRTHPLCIPEDCCFLKPLYSSSLNRGVLEKVA